MRRYLLPALLLILIVAAFAWTLYGPRSVTVPVVSPPGGGVEVVPMPDGTGLLRGDLRTDEGRTAAATAAAPGGEWVLTGRAWSERGEPVAGVTIRLISGVSRGWGAGDARFFLTNRPDYASVVTGEDGRYLIRLAAAPEPSRRDWSRSSPGILSDRHAGRPALKDLPIDFMEHGGECDLVLRSGIGLVGRVLAPDGTPAAFATLNSSAGMMWTADEAGRFRAPVPLQRDLDLSFHHETGVLRLTSLQAVPNADLVLGDVRLRGPGRLAGRVILSDGSPAPQLRISFTSRTLRARLAADRDALNGSDDGRMEGWAVTDAAGHFRVPGLTIDEFLPECRATGVAIPLRAHGAAADSETWLQSGPESDGHLLVLPWRMLLVDVPEYEPGMDTLSYMIQASAAESRDPPPSGDFRLLASGHANPSELPIVFLYDSATWIRVVAAVNTKATGTALIPMQPEPWLSHAAVSLEPFGATGKILVRASNAEGESITGLNAELRDPRTGTVVLGTWPRWVEEGLEYGSVPAGLWTLILSSRDYFADNFVLAESMPVEVRAGETREIDWRPRQGGLLQIVVDTDGTGAASGALPDITATVLAGPAHVGNLLTVVEDGRRRPVRAQFPPSTVMVVAGVLEPGTYRIRFDAVGFAPAESAIEVRAADIVRVEARLSAAP